MSPVVVRFAPSPTGYLHIGGARTAIFNWLYARKHGGKFILRIEDTDAERSTRDAIAGILDGLTWLGIDWDEGPHFQSAHTEAHLRAARTLLANGWAYKCFCGQSDLERKRDAAQRAKETYRYDGTCRQLTPAQVAEKEAAGQPYVIRLRVPETDDAVRFDDAVVGRVEKRYRDMDDFVLVRTNGRPLYVLANAVDDIRDGVTHIIRGQDGLANTPKQILIYRGLQAPLPVFAHMSLTLDPGKAKISKRRHGSQVAIHYYREQGFLPWAMVNFLALLGWATAESRELFTPHELIDAFDLDGISRTNSVFNIRPDDPKFITDPKLLNINAHYLRSMPVDELIPHIKAWLLAEDLWDPAYDTDRKEWLAQTVSLLRERFHVLADFVTTGRAFFSETYAIDAAARQKHLLTEGRAPVWLSTLADRIDTVDPYDKAGLERMLHDFLKTHGLKAGQLINAVRVAVTGQTKGPEFVQVLLCLGRARVADRLRRQAGAR